MKKMFIGIGITILFLAVSNNQCMADENVVSALNLKDHNDEKIVPEPKDGKITAYSATGEELGIIVGFSKAPDPSSGELNQSATVFLTELDRFFEFSLDYGETDYPMQYFTPLYFEGDGCSDLSDPYIKYGENESAMSAFNMVVTYWGIDSFILEEITEPVIVNCVLGDKGTYQPCVDDCVLDVGRGYYKFVKVTLPFNYPLILPVSFE